MGSKKIAKISHVVSRVGQPAGISVYYNAPTSIVSLFVGWRSHFFKTVSLNSPISNDLCLFEYQRYIKNNEIITNIFKKEISQEY